MLDARFQTKENGTSSAQLRCGKLREDSWLLLGSGRVNWDGTVKFPSSVWRSSVGSRCLSTPSSSLEMLHIGFRNLG